MKHLTTTSEVIDELGGTGAAARFFDRKVTTVGMWKVNGRFPSTAFLLMTAKLRERGITAPASLWSMEPAPAKAEAQA